MQSGKDESGNAVAVAIRRAREADAPTLVEFNCRMARETEHKTLDAILVAQGVAAVFANPARGFYLVAEREEKVVAQLMITFEWSDWRNSTFWWIQSVYVHEDARRSGIFRTMYREVERLARAAGNVVGLRLYVEKDNVRAQLTYESLGMPNAGYVVHEVTFESR